RHTLGVTFIPADPTRYATVSTAVTLEVEPAALTITADDQSLVYNAPLPALTWSGSGFIAGEGPADLTTAPTCTTPAAPGSPAGTYPITCSGAAADNYTITYQAGTLTITQAAQAITFPQPEDVTYGAGPLTLTATA